MPLPAPRAAVPRSRLTAGRLDALVLDLDTRAGLAIARALSRGGLAVAVAARERASGLGTRHARSRAVLPRPERDFAGYASGIVGLLEAGPADVVVPSTDWSVEALALLRGRLDGLALPALAGPAAVAVATSKGRTLEVARRLGIPSPRTIAAATPAEVRAAARELGLPAVVKPDASWRALDGGGVRVGPVYVATDEELRAAAATLLAAGGRVLVQEYAPGRRTTVKLFSAAGATLARLAMRVERTWPVLGGSSVMRWTIPLADAPVEAAEALVSEIGLDGYSEVEFRRDRSGRHLLMEVNARLSQSVELAIRAGVDFARMQLDWARGAQVRPVAGYRVGERLGWLGGDLRILVASAARAPGCAPLPAAVRAFAGDYGARRARIDGFELGDPRPMLAAAGAALRAAVPRRPGARAPSRWRG